MQINIYQTGYKIETPKSYKTHNPMIIKLRTEKNPNKNVTNIKKTISSKIQFTKKIEKPKKKEQVVERTKNKQYTKTHHQNPILKLTHLETRTHLAFV